MYRIIIKPFLRPVDTYIIIIIDDVYIYIYIHVCAKQFIPLCRMLLLLLRRRIRSLQTDFRKTHAQYILYTRTNHIIKNNQSNKHNMIYKHIRGRAKCYDYGDKTTSLYSYILYIIYMCVCLYIGTLLVCILHYNINSALPRRI